MNKYIRFICVLLAFSLGFSACDDDDDNSQTDTLTTAFATSVLKTMENVTPLMIPVTLNAKASRDIEITVAVKSEEGAKEGVHYRFQNKVITIPQGSAIGYFYVDVTDDREINPDRVFTVEIVQVKGATLATHGVTCKVMIQSDEGYPDLGFQNTQISAQEETPVLKVPVILSKPYSAPVTFKVKIKEGGLAVAGEHFLLDTEKEYTIAAGDTLLNLDVTVVDDDFVNENRTFELQLAESANSQISQVYQECKVTIFNDDRDAYVSFIRKSAEAFESDGFIWIPVKVSGIYKLPVTVTLRIEDGTAAGGTDCSLENNVLVFENGKMEDSVKLMIYDNEIINTDRDLKLYVSQVEGALRAEKDSIMNVTILNDDVNYVSLYDDLMGSWTIKQSRNDVAKSATMEIYGGDTPDEEDANYQKFLICKIPGYREGKDVKMRLSFDAVTHELKVVTGETEIAMPGPLGFAGDLGNARILLYGNYGVESKLVSITVNKNFRELTCDPAVVLYGMIQTIATGKVNAAHYFALENVVMTKNK